MNTLIYRPAWLAIVAALALTPGCQLFRDFSRVDLDGGAGEDVEVADAGPGDGAADAADVRIDVPDVAVDARDGGEGDAADADMSDAGSTLVEECPDPIPQGTVYYVSPDGGPVNDGSRASPWDVETAADNVTAGDTVLYLPGTYTDGFWSSASGAPDAPIVLRSDVRHEAVVLGSSGNGFGFRFEGNSHYRVEGFRFVDTTSKWVYAVDSDHLEFVDLWCDGHTGVAVPFDVERGEHIALVDSVVRGTFKFILADFKDSSFVRIEGNAFSIAPGRPLSVDGSDHVVVRGNVVHNTVGAGLYTVESDDALVEGNLISNTIEGPGAYRSFGRAWGRRMIFRHNRFFRTWGTAHSVETVDGMYSTGNVRIYHNVFDDIRDVSRLDGEGLAVFGDDLTDVVVTNNAFTRNGGDGPSHLRGDGWNGEVSVDTNLFWDDAMTPSVNVEFSSMTVADADANEPAFRDNLVADPQYVDEAIYDHRPGAQSPLVDAARPLATVTMDGNGMTLPVDDTYPFFDGFGMVSQFGDLIAIGDPGNVARVASVDHTTGTLVLDRSMSYSAGDAVQAPWNGAAPDIGVHESGAPTSLRIEASSFVLDRDDTLHLEPVFPDGVDPVRVQWRLGDGTLVCTRTVDHSYAQPGDYPVRLRMLDTDGRTHRATAYVLVGSASVDVDSLSYNVDLMDDELCDGGAHSYTNDQTGRDSVARESGGEGYECVQ